MAQITAASVPQHCRRLCIILSTDQTVLQAVPTGAIPSRTPFGSVGCRLVNRRSSIISQGATRTCSVRGMRTASAADPLAAYAPVLCFKHRRSDCLAGRCIVALLLHFVVLRT